MATSAAETAPLTTMASAIFFGSILFCTAALSAKSFATGEFSSLHKAAHHPRSTALDLRSFLSVYTLLVHLSILGLILFYAYICEYHPPYPHAGKVYDRDEFFFLTALLIVVSAFTWKNHESHAKPVPKREKSQENGELDNGSEANHVSIKDSSFISAYERPVAPPNDALEVLNRDQTEEWKGWMQFMFLLYHYFHAEEVYNSIRIMITCYVWMTGFGNFSFFYLKGDYGSIRVMQMLWRLNFLVAFLCLTQGTTYILYYICLLHTYFFLMVYATMRVAKHINYTKYGIRIKLACLAVIIFLVWDVDLGLFRAMHWLFLGNQPMLGATSGAMWEWYFRSTLDHWSTFFGMLFALNFPITSLFFRKLEAQPFHIHVMAKGSIAIVFVAATYWWVTNPFMLGKFDYNQTNAYYGWIPVLAYIYLRNLTPWMRGRTLELLHQIGKTTLETYLMQHHIWLTSDAKSLLTLIPGWPRMNFLAVTILYVFFSRRLYQLTLFLRGMILPNDRTACIRNLSYLVASLAGSVLLAFMLRAADVLSLTTVGVCSLLFGGFMYKAVTEQTTSDGSNGSRRTTTHPAVFWIVGALAIFVVGSGWNTMAEKGAGKIRPLTAECEKYVNNGSWIAVDACNEGIRGDSYRENGIGSLGTCGPLTQSYVWGWEAAPSNTHCRVVPRDKKSLTKTTLKHRQIMFMGDSTVRHLYHASCRQLGDTSAGAFNTTQSKWTDYSKKFGSAEMGFRWSPFVYDLTKKLQEVQASAVKPDLIVLGGGAWDRLHHYGSDAEQARFAKNVTTLAAELKKTRDMGVPVAWSTPTVINTWALSDDKNNKRENIREDQIAALRKLYEDKGVLRSASFVLDGPSYTAKRASESYDGVHYPFQVYDAGAQILANAYDWLLLEKDTSDPFNPPRPGSMANPALGLMMLTFCAVALFLFDGFMGASYLVAFCVPSCMPANLYFEAFSSLHSRAKLPPVEPEEGSFCFGGGNSFGGSNTSQHSAEDFKSKLSDRHGDPESDDERESFIQSIEKDTEMRVV